MTEPQTAEWMTESAIEPDWSTHRMMSRRADLRRPRPTRVAGMTVRYSGW